MVVDSRRSRERVQLAEEAHEYDAGFYAEQLVRAADSVVSPVGWCQGDIEEYLAERTDASVTGFGKRRVTINRFLLRWRFRSTYLNCQVHLLNALLSPVP